MGTIATKSNKNRARVGRPAGGFTQHRRLDRLREVLENQPLGLTLEALAGTLNVTQRSVRRYLRELDGTKAEEKYELLEYVETKKGGPLLWRIKPGERGRAVLLRRAQAYALLATRQALEVLRGSALYDEADLALAQIAKVAQTPFRTAGKAQILGDRGLENRFFIVPPPARSYAARGEDLDELFRSVADLRVLRYKPRVPRGTSASIPPPPPRATDARDRVAFHPYALVVHDGGIFVLGIHPSQGRTPEIDIVPLEAMTDIRTSETEHFDLPNNFDPAAFVHADFGVARPTRARFVVEFEARVADEVKARRLHPQQRIATAPDGRVRVSLPLVDPRAAITFILSWGDAARVVEPPELVDEVGRILKRAALRYASGDR